MCGICGWVGKGRIDEQRLNAMATSLIHRGPDGFGLHIDEGIGIAHRRLAIIDIDGGAQPMPNEDESLWLAINGEIYNFQEIRSSLLERGHEFRTKSDSEVVLHLYEEYGKNCVKHLRGMFSFVIWDSNQKHILAARDHLGQKPFFYASRGDNLIFASEIKSLLAFDPDLRELDLEALDQYFTLRIIPSPRTMFKEIKKIPPAHILTFKVGGTPILERYWDIEFEPKLKGSDEEMINKLTEKITGSLKLHMVSDVPVGAFLSGGLDSTLVVAMLMAHVQKNRIPTFTGSLPYKDFDEAPYARLVAERYNTDHKEELITPSLMNSLPRLVANLDEPADPLCVAVERIAAIASKDVKVVLGGDGGDELFGGYDRYRGLGLVELYAKIPSFFRNIIINPFINLFPKGGWYRSIGNKLGWMQKLGNLNESERYAAALGYFYFDRKHRLALYGPKMENLAKNGDPAKPIREAFEKAKTSDLFDRMVYADWQTRLPDHSVMILDRMTMAHSLEARSPFLDHKMVEFMAHLPTRVKLRGNSLRWIQRKVCERYLPKDILNRPKQGFASALPYILANEYRKLADTFLSKSHLARDGFLKQTAVNSIVIDHQMGKSDHSSRLWLLINAEVWYRLYIEKFQVKELQEEILYPNKSEV